MTTHLLPLIDAFAGIRVLVLGEAMLDSYLEGSTGRFCQEAPVPVVTLAGRRDLPGGAANAAVNARHLGAEVTFLSVIGNDPEGTALQRALQESGLPTEGLLSDPARRTMTKSRVVAASHLLLRLDQGSTGAIDRPTEDALIARLTEAFPQADAVIVSDYGYGIVTPRMIRVLADLQQSWPRVVVADSRRLDVYRDVGLTAAKPNYDEATALLGNALSDGRLRAERMSRHGDRLLAATGARLVALTLDSEGAILFEAGRPPYRTYAQAVRRACVAGAGDTFTSALAMGLAVGSSSTCAAELASAAAAIVVGKESTAVCSAQELREQISAGGKYLPDLTRLAARAEFYRQQGRRIAFTNGCFDILHRGHITYLNRARSLGDILIVGVNSDAGIRRLKGPDRPINTLEDRMQVLAALNGVDHLVAFDDDTPCNLIRAVRPDVFVKGGDYTRDRLPEAALVEQLGGTVQILPYLDDRSTTGIIERIKQTPGRASERTTAGGAV